MYDSAKILKYTIMPKNIYFMNKLCQASYTIIYNTLATYLLVLQHSHSTLPMLSNTAK